MRLGRELRVIEVEPEKLQPAEPPASQPNRTEPYPQRHATVRQSPSLLSDR